MSCINRVYFWTLCKASMPSDETSDPPDRTTMAKGWLTKLSCTTESYCASFFGLSTFKIGFRPFQRLSTITARRACHPICPMSRWAESPWRKDLLTQFSCTLNTQTHIVPSLSWTLFKIRAYHAHGDRALGVRAQGVRAPGVRAPGVRA